MDGGTGQNEVKVTIAVSEDLFDAAREHVEAGDLAVTCILSQHVPLGNGAPREALECTVETLYSGGWIACSTALALAEALGVPARDIGRLLDLLRIKVKRCSLGLFE
jgi:hypothetical protein